jgi:hypothetical protein
MIVMENQDDERCCGTGTCIINAQGLCWCGQQWDGEKMCRAAPASTSAGSSGNAVPMEKPVLHRNPNPSDSE